MPTPTVIQPEDLLLLARIVRGESGTPSSGRSKLAAAFVTAAETFDGHPDLHPHTCQAFILLALPALFILGQDRTTLLTLEQVRDCRSESPRLSGEIECPTITHVCSDAWKRIVDMAGSPDDLAACVSMLSAYLRHKEALLQLQSRQIELPDPLPLEEWLVESGTIAQILVEHSYIRVGRAGEAAWGCSHERHSVVPL
jgi:hypothetical protein